MSDPKEENVEMKPAGVPAPNGPTPTSPQSAPAPDEEARPAASVEDAADKSWRSTLRRLIDLDEEDGTPSELSLRTLLGGEILARWLKRNVVFVMLLVLYSLAYVTNRYAVQQEMIENNRLNDTLLDRRYRALSYSSEVLERTLRSRVEGSLADSTLQTSTHPSYVLKVE